MRRLAFGVTEYGFSTKAQEAQLADLLERALTQTVEFGYRQARTEITKQRVGTKTGGVALSSGAAVSEPQAAIGRSSTTGAHPVLNARYAVPDAGYYARTAAEGLDGIKRLVRHRVERVAAAVAGDASTEAHAQATNPNRIEAKASVLVAASKSMHNQVLELVGEALNLGRTAGAYSFERPPEFALRSEQLDKNTCDACTTEHGDIFRVGSDEFYAHTPPADCYGGGRCRGIWVFGD